MLQSLTTVTEVIGLYYDRYNTEQVYINFDFTGLQTFIRNRFIWTICYHLLRTSLIVKYKKRWKTDFNISIAFRNSCRWFKLYISICLHVKWFLLGETGVCNRSIMSLRKIVQNLDIGKTLIPDANISRIKISTKFMSLDGLSIIQRKKCLHLKVNTAES